MTSAWSTATSTPNWGVNSQELRGIVDASDYALHPVVLAGERGSDQIVRILAGDCHYHVGPAHIQCFQHLRVGAVSFVDQFCWKLAVQVG